MHYHYKIVSSPEILPSFTESKSSMVRLEYHDFEGRQGLEKREGLMLVLLFDGI